MLDTALAKWFVIVAAHYNHRGALKKNSNFSLHPELLNQTLEEQVFFKAPSCISDVQSRLVANALRLILKVIAKRV